MKYNIEILSPIHIGNGNKYSQLDSIMTDEYFYAINMNSLMKIVQEEGKLDEFTAFLEKGGNIQNYIYMKLRKISLDSVSKYKIKTTPQNKLDVQHIDEIHQFIKNARNDVYLPGSEIKGAIRTAIIYSILAENNEAYNHLKELILQNIRFAEQFIDRILRSKHAMFDHRARVDAKHDLMKFIQVGDSSHVSPATLSISHLYSEGSSGKDAYVETLDGGSLNGTLNILYRSLNIEKLDLKDRVKYLATKGLLESLYKFSTDMIKHETQFAYDKKLDPLRNFYDDLKKKNQEDEPLLRLGAGQGFLSTTIGLIIKNRDPEVFEDIRESLPPWMKTYPNDFPKTRRMVKNGNDLRPLGWVKLRLIE